jgi:hypothetical protein
LKRWAGLKELTEAKALKLQKRLAHYLRGYRKRSNLTQSVLADNLGYTELHYRRLEGTHPDNIVVKAVDTLAFFADLQGMSAIDFLSYLEQKNFEGKSDLFPWEKTLLLAFHELDLETRMTFVHKLCSKVKSKDGKDGRDRLRLVMEIAVALEENLSDEQLTKTIEFIQVFKN